MQGADSFLPSFLFPSSVSPRFPSPVLIPILRFIASAGTYANLVKQAKSKQKIIDKMEAAGLIEKIEMVKPLRFNFEDVSKLPPPILAFNEVAFAYSGKSEDYLYKNLSFGIECVCLSTSARVTLD